MYFAINHKIHNQKAFWNAIKQIKSNLSNNILNYAVLPNMDKDEAITIWKAPNQFAIEQLIEEQTDDFSRNVYLEIDEESATGLFQLHANT